MPDDSPKFGAANKAPPSWFARVPTGAIMDLKITNAELRVFNVLCSYANSQGFAYPNQQTLRKQANQHLNTTRKGLDKLRKKGYIEIVSTYRSHPKWRHVMGNVYRIIYDKRLSQEELISAMDKEDPPPIQEKDIPIQQDETIQGDSNHGEKHKGYELVEVEGVARWYAEKCSQIMGQLRLVNPRSIEETARILETMTIEECKARALAKLNECREARRDTPHHLGWLA